MLPVLPPALAAELAAIREDRIQGAMPLARRAASAVLAAGPLPPEIQRAVAAEIASVQPMMAPLLHLSLRLRGQAGASGVCRVFIEEIDRADERIAARMLTLLPDQAAVLTHSYSQTVAGVLLRGHAEGKVARVIATESRPLREGERLASILSARGIAADLIVDAAAGLAMSEVNVVLVGADWISEDAVVNKIGTRLVALAAHERGVPVYAVASELKIAPSGFPTPSEDSKNPLEITRVPGLRARNYYFESTPRRWFTGIVTDRES